jgi:hypothetical protein
MNSHKHAALTPIGRALLVRRVLHDGWKVAEASHAAGVSERTGYKWLARFKAEGAVGLLDRSSRPDHCPHETSPRCDSIASNCAARSCLCGAWHARVAAVWPP